MKLENGLPIHTEGYKFFDSPLYPKRNVRYKRMDYTTMKIEEKIIYKQRQPSTEMC